MSATSKMTERSCELLASVSTSAPSRTTPPLGASECSVTHSSMADRLVEKSRSRSVDAPSAAEGTDTHRTSSLLTHVASVSLSAKRHRRSLNSWKLLPCTRTSVLPPVVPLLGLRLDTTSGSWYRNWTRLRLCCCPFMLTSSATPAAAAPAGDVHVRLPPSS